MLRRRSASALALLLLCSIAYAQSPYIPDHERTPGGINLDVTQENIKHTVCVSGWTATIRPPMAYTNHLKVRQLRELGFARNDPRLPRGSLGPAVRWRPPDRPAQPVASAARRQMARRGQESTRAVCAARCAGEPLH